MSQYMPVSKFYFFHGENIPESVMVSVLCEGDFNRFYFHDQTPGNFVLIVVTSAPNGRLLVETHYNVSPESEGRSVLEIFPAKLVETVRLMLTTAVAAGFGK